MSGTVWRRAFALISRHRLHPISKGKSHSFPPSGGMAMAARMYNSFVYGCIRFSQEPRFTYKLMFFICPILF